ncbi:hypothetical protein TeGR_g3296 [Tetraparma gracilis]|uniref:Uncharacterized protein n=1 Tax=Tetraparma gracilis TaxID=2962635 RepID=A0ABQ6N8S4_9STRA|nr:hypothetical protein TeGR_g3296 [Tetraparma gracilis]
MIRGLPRLPPTKEFLIDSEFRERLVKKFSEPQEYTPEELTAIEMHCKLFSLFESKRQKTLEKFGNAASSATTPPAQPRKVEGDVEQGLQGSGEGENARKMRKSIRAKISDMESTGVHEAPTFGLHKIKSTCSQVEGEWLYDKKTQNCYAKSTGVISTTALDALAYAWDLRAQHWGDAEAKAKVGMSAQKNELLKQYNDHCLIMRDVRKMPTPFLNREFIHKVIWYQASENEYVMIAFPCEFDYDSKNVLRAVATRICKFKQKVSGASSEWFLSSPAQIESAPAAAAGHGG